jgi:ubiquinone/menaquinone biosynthesis C-methylase UbiE
MTEADNRQRVRERFTRTAENFAKFSLATRAAEAAHLVSLAAPRGDELAIDVACGPGTFTREFAPHVRAICGVDLTPALLAHAPAASARASLANTMFVCGDAAAIPFAGEQFDLACCAYAVHHFAAPQECLRGLARVVRRGGRVALVDIAVPAGSDPAATNAIERARDASHATTFTRDEFAELFAAAGLRIRRGEFGTRPRSFNDWMQIAGWKSGDPAYAATRRMLETHLEHDTSGFAPQRDGEDLSFTQTSLFLIAERA